MICVDEKPSIQAVERAQGYLKFPNGRALSGQSHDYKRHGTSTLFAALEVATGKVMTADKRRRRRIEFLDFMNEIAIRIPPSMSSSTISTPISRKTTAAAGEGQLNGAGRNMTPLRPCPLSSTTPAIAVLRESTKRTGTDSAF